jgi:hypothetical protein
LQLLQVKMRTVVVVLAALITVSVIACGGDTAGEPSPGRGQIEFSEPFGNLSIDASPGDNTASSVGPIGDTADVTDTACGDGNPEIVVELVVGNPGGGGSIPAGEEIGGWQARIQFDPAVLTFAGFQASDSAAGAQFFMEKASDQTPSTNDHLTVVDPQPGPGTGTFDIGSTIIGIPPGANGVGLLARLLFDCVASGGTCIDIGDSTYSFYADIQEPRENHNYVERNSASLSVNGGTAPAICPQFPTPTPAPTPTPTP